jgi:hypothetical protein
MAHRGARRVPRATREPGRRGACSVAAPSGGGAQCWHGAGAADWRGGARTMQMGACTPPCVSTVLVRVAYL